MLDSGKGILLAGECDLSGVPITVSGVDGIDVSEIKQCKIKTGTYSGDNVDDRDIDIGIDLASKTFAFVMIRCRAGTGKRAVFRPDTLSGDNAMLFIQGAGLQDNVIQEFNATGFQIGTHIDVNVNGEGYDYIVLWEE